MVISCRSLVAKVKRLEKEIYLVQKTMIEEDSQELITEIEELESEVSPFPFASLFHIFHREIMNSYLFRR